MGELNRNALLEKEVLEVEKVKLDKGAFTYVRQMTGRERDRFDQSLMQEVKDRSGNKTYERNLSDFRAKLAVNTLCDKAGKNLLTQKDVGTLSQNMSAARLEKIVTKSQDLNKITEEDKENLVKNSEGDQVADSNSDSV